MQNTSQWGKIIMALLLGIAIGYAAGSRKPPQIAEPTETAPETQTVMFVNHIQANLPEQDVFIMKQEGDKEVWRVEGDQAKDPETIGKMVYAASQKVEHDPFKLGSQPLGPFPKGKSLGMTLEQWLAGTGTGTYLVNGDSAELDITLQNLVPNGTYTVWCSRITFPPNVAIVDKPCGAEDGSENIFQTDEEGNATFSLTMNPLEPSTQETASVIAVAYHSDGKTYGPIPGDFGLVTHVQLFYLLPAPTAQ